MKKRTNLKRVVLASTVLLGAAMIGSKAAETNAANWTGTNGGTGSWLTVGTTAPTPGWDSLAFPSAVGDVAQFISPTTGNAETVQDAGAPVIVGAINYGANNNMGDFSWTITNTSGLTLNQDNTDPLSSTITNSNTNTGTNNALIFNSGTITLGDDLRVTNSSSSTAPGGAIQINSIIAGGTNPVVYRSEQAINLVNSSLTTNPGAIRLTGINTGTGAVTIEKGTVAFTTAGATSAAFGTATNVTLGNAIDPSESAAILFQTSTNNGAMARPIVIAAGTGSRIVGFLPDVNAATYTMTYSGTMTLNGDVTLYNPDEITGAITGGTVAVGNMTGLISGVGGVRKIGAGMTFLNNTGNSYSGDTVIDEGVIATGNTNIPDGAGKGNVIINSAGTLTMSSNSATGEIINGLSGSGTIRPYNGNKNFTVGGNNQSSEFSGTIGHVNFTNLGNGAITLHKIGTGTLTLSGTSSTYLGKTDIQNGTIDVKSINSVNGGTPLLASSSLGAPITVANGTIELGATTNTGTLKYTGAGETTDRVINLLGTTGGGGIDSSGSGALVFSSNFTATGAGSKTLTLTGTNTDANTIGGAIIDNSISNVTSVAKTGDGKWVLAGTNSYTGNTTVSGGTLEIATTGSIDTSAAVNVAAGGTLVTDRVRNTALTVDGVTNIRANGGTAGASKVETLTIGGSGKLNLKDNDLVVGTAANVDAVRTAIVAGKTNNAASGITSDVAAFGTTTGFGYAMGNDVAISPLLGGFLTGQGYDSDSVLVKYTFLGDADLDGDSDLNDLGLWAQAFTGDLGNPVNPATYWTSGDFDYDGDTDLNDLGFWAGTFTGDLGGGAGSLIVVAPGAPAGAVAALNSMGITVVPEPSTFVLAGVGLAGLAIAARRKRSK